MSKTYTRLVEEVVFESGATNFRNAEVIAGLIIEEHLDSLTAQIKYDDLYVRDYSLVVDDLATGILTLPTDGQHYDWYSFRILPLGDTNNQFALQPFDGAVTGNSEGGIQYYSRNSTSISVWPYGELDVTDTFLINYWRKSNAKTNNLIVPDGLVLTVKQRAIAQLGMALGNKIAGDYFALSKQSHSESLGAVDLPPL